MVKTVSFITCAEDKFYQQLSVLFDWADEINLCVSYATYGAFRLLSKKIEDFLRKGGKLRTIFDIERMVTEAKIIEELVTIPGDSQCKVFFRDESSIPLDGSFHSKLYIFKKNCEAKVVVGSSNFTLSGIKENIEANISIEGDAKADIFNEFFNFFKTIWDSKNSVLPTDSLIQDYYQAILISSKHRKKFERHLKKSRVGVEKTVKETQIEIENGLNTETAYLLGLIAGSGCIPNLAEKFVTIRYHRRPFQRGTRNEGMVCAHGISELKLNQADALNKDINGIKEKLESLFKKYEPYDRVEILKKSDYDYHIQIRFGEGSRYWLCIKKFTEKCKKKRMRIIPVIPQEILDEKKSHIPLAFIRGYVDVRSRISIEDREGLDGPLRIAISISQGATDFAKHLEGLIKKHIGVKRLKVFSGEPRGRETMLRCDPAELPGDFFLSPWQRMLLGDFAKYNKERYPQRYKRRKNI